MFDFLLDVTQNFDYIFWSGDLNFRLATPRSKVLEWLSKTSFPLPPHMPHGYLHHDQLCSVLADGAAFRGFCEANIRFPPTYKVIFITQIFWYFTNCLKLVCKYKLLKFQ